MGGPVNIIISGAYQTKFGELWDKSLHDLISEAVDGALQDALLSKKGVEIVFLGNKMASQVSDQNHLSAMIVEILGHRVPVVRVESACASGGVALSQACLALKSGQYNKVLVVGAEKMTDLPIDNISYALMHAASEQERDAGLSFVGLYALMAKQYLQMFDAKEQDLAFPAIKNHEHAKLNPNAQFPFSISIDQVMQSALVADPLRLLHCSGITDGAAAIVLEKKSGKNNQVQIVASVQTGETLALSERKDLVTLESTKEAAQSAYQQAGLGPEDIDLWEVHDCFTIAEILAIEDLGICPKGEGFIVVRNQECTIGGNNPVNVSGGLKACGHPVGATGIKQVVEVYNQLKGRAGARQLDNPLVGLTHNVGGTGGTVVVHILKM